AWRQPAGHSPRCFDAAGGRPLPSSRRSGVLRRSACRAAFPAASLPRDSVETAARTGGDRVSAWEPAGRGRMREVKAIAPVLSARNALLLPSAAGGKVDLVRESGTTLPGLV